MGDPVATDEVNETTDDSVEQTADYSASEVIASEGFSVVEENDEANATDQSDPPEPAVGRDRQAEGAEGDKASIGVHPRDGDVDQAMEMRQVAGLTAGSMMKLPLGRTFEFNESNEGGSFSLRVLDNGETAIIPGTADAVVDEVEVTDPLIIGNAILNVSSACFAVRSPRPPASNETRMDGINAAFASTSAIPVPALGPDNPVDEGVRRGSRLGALLDRHPLTQGPVGRNAWGFLQSIRETRAVAAERHRLIHPDPEELKTRLTRLDPGLWDRNTDHALFGRFSIGYATIPWEPRFDNPELIPEHLHDAIVDMSLLPWVPVTANLFFGPLGIVGRRAARLAASRHAILSMAALSVPGSVRFSFVTGRNTTDSWQWTTALPPVTAPDGNGGYLIVVLDGIENLPMSGYDEAQAVDRQMGMIALAETVQELPDNCGTILQIHADGTGTVTNHLGETIQVTPIGVTEAYAHDMATRIADILGESLF